MKRLISILTSDTTIRIMDSYLPPMMLLIVAGIVIFTFRGCVDRMTITQTDYSGWRQKCEQAGGVVVNNELCFDKKVLVNP